MRILILHSRYLSGEASGENRVVEDEARLLREAGHDVLTWVPTPRVSGVGQQLHAGASAVWSTLAARRVAGAVVRGGIEVVHVHNLFPALSPSVLPSARSSGAAVVLTLHNYRLMCLPANFLLHGRVCERCLGHLPWRGIVHRCYRASAMGSATLASSLAIHRGLHSFDAVSRFLAVSDFVRRKHAEGGIPEERIVVKPNFTWPVEPRRGPGQYFLYVGRLGGEKGVDTLLRAWATRPRHPLVVVGDGPEGNKLRSVPVTGVEFRGAVPAGEVPALIAGARAVLVPSRWYEAAPRVIIEAYAAGVPVVASDIGALPDLIRDGISGILALPDDASAWASAVARLAEDKECERLGEGALRTWEELYSPEKGLEGLERAYRDARRAS